MKKTILILSLSIALFSCTKNKEQIEVSKSKLLELNVTKAELVKYEFIVDEAFEKDIYNMIIDYYRDRSSQFTGYPEVQMKYLSKAEEYYTMMEKISGDKTFYRVRALRIVGDTLNDKTLFLDNNNRIVDYINKR